jgi:hypothetical protein
VIIAVNNVVAWKVLRSTDVAVTLLAVGVTVVPDGTVVAGTTRVAFFADTLTRFHIARLLRRAHLVAVAVFAAF